MDNYIFTSERLGFRNWKKSDLNPLFKMNSNKEVMKFFPHTQSKLQSQDFIHKMQEQFKKNSFCYFAVEIIETKTFIGFIGLNEQTYKIDFNPSIDIGWRLLPEFWGKGFATEGAQKCLQYAFETLKLPEVVSVAPNINTPSIEVMKKIKMTKVKNFSHPLLLNFPNLKQCVLYKKTN